MLHDLFVTGRDFNSETHEAFIKVLEKQTNISIHVINKNRLNGKHKIQTDNLCLRGV